MGLKRTLSSILVLMLLLTLSVTVTAAQDDMLKLGQISVNMPEITVELKGTEYTETDISATLGAEPLSLETMAGYDPAMDTTRVYALVDVSKSVKPKWFDLMKASIVSYIEAMGDKDELVLITFGEKSADTVLSGDEEKEEAIAVVNSLQCDQNYTMFYEALSHAYQMFSSSAERYDREYVLVFSDGIDDQKGGTTEDEVLNQYDSRALPVYAAYPSDAEKAGVDALGKITRISGGDMSPMESNEDFAALAAKINDVTLLRFRAGSNYADGQNKQLSLKIGDAFQIALNVPIIRSQPDEQPPVVVSATYDADKTAIVIAFSEKVLGASDTKAYKVTGPEGVVAVSGVYYSENEDVYELLLADSALNGSYTISFSGITDASQQANSLSGESTVLIDNGVDPTTPQKKPAGTVGSEKNEEQTGQIPLSGWYIAAGAVVVVLIAAAVVVILVVSKKKEQDESAPTAATPGSELYEYDQANADVVKHHIKADNSLRIRLRIVTGKTSEQNIETNLVSSLIVGRSDACDIYIDDTKMSRQHFVLESDGGELYIMDLQSRNGTMLNGIRIGSRHTLHSGDRILAGLSEIVITIIGR